MVTHGFKLLLFVLLIIAIAVPMFAEGEWEDPENAPGAESVNEEPAGDEVGEAQPSEAATEMNGDTLALDGPELEPPKDTFPVVHAAEARAPRPRNPDRILGSVDVVDLTEKLDADRRLLSEIRKDVPEAKEEAELYLVRLKKLAEESDPMRLVPLFDRVLDQAPIYFTWLETEYDNQDEQITEYYVGGARGFAFAMDNFRAAVFLVIMNRLDIASRVISELE